MALTVDIEKTMGDFLLRVSFEAEAETMGLLGASGSGKSMTLKCIAGVATPDRGRILLNGRTLFDSEKHIDLPPQQRQVGYLFQNYALFSHMTVEKNIAAGVRAKDTGEKRRIVAEKLRAMRLEGLEKKLPHQLSGGQQQRVALARILAGEPELLLLDEPFAALDSYLKWQLELELMDNLDGFFGETLFVSHSRDEVYRLCSTVCVLDAGRSQSKMPVADLFGAPRTLAACLLSGCKNISRAEKRGPHRLFAQDWQVCLYTKQPVPDELTHIGVRSHGLRPVQGEGENIFRCEPLRAVENLFSEVVMLTTPAGRAEENRLRMVMDKEAFQDWKDQKQWSVFLPPDEILLLCDEP